MYCTKEGCKNQLKPNDKFCGVCGTPVDKLNVYGELFARGDMESFNQIYSDSFLWVRKETVTMLYNHPGDVEDCMQEIYMKLYNSISSFKPEEGNFRPWFNRLIKNQIIDYWNKIEGRKKKYDITESSIEANEEANIELESFDTSTMPEVQMDQKETSRLVQEMMDDLSDEQRMCLVYYMNQMKLSEISDIMGIPVGTVKSRISYGKKIIESKVKNLEKQGTKLYSLTALPFLFALLREMDIQYTSANPTVSNTVATKVNQSLSKEVIKIDDQTNLQSSFSDQENQNVNNQPVNSANHVKNPAIEKAVRKETINRVAKTGAKSVAKTGAKALAGKIVVGVAAVVIIGSTLGALGYHFNNNQRNTETDQTEQETEVQVKEQQLQELKDNLDIDTLQSWFIYLPTFDKKEEISDDLFQSILWRSAMVRYTADKSSVTGSSQLIAKDDIIALDTSGQDDWTYGYNIVVAKNAFNNLMECLGLPSDYATSINGKTSYGTTLFKYENNQFIFTMQGLGGYGNYSCSMHDVTVESDAVYVKYEYVAENGGEIIDECRVAMLVPADNEKGFKVQNIKIYTPEESNPEDSRSLYQDVISAYSMAVASGGNDIDSSFIPDNSGIYNPPSGFLIGSEQGAKELYAAFYDINNDGIDECFFSEKPDVEKNTFPSYLDIWTMKDGQPSLLLMGGYRTTQVLCENGILRFEASAGAFTGQYIYYKVEDGECYVEDSLSWDGDSSGIQYYHSEDFTNPILEEEAKKIEDNYLEIQVSFEWRALVKL